MTLVDCESGGARRQYFDGSVDKLDETVTLDANWH